MRGWLRDRAGGVTDQYLRDYEHFYTDLSAGSGLNSLLRDPEHGEDKELPAGVTLTDAPMTVKSRRSRPPMLPGLSRMQWAPASIDLSATGTSGQPSRASQ